MRLRLDPQRKVELDLHDTALSVLRKGETLTKADLVEANFLDEMALVGLTPRNLMSALQTLVISGESDGIKLQAIKFATQLYMHPAFVNERKGTEGSAPAVTFNIEGAVQINNVIKPYVKEDQYNEVIQ